MQKLFLRLGVALVLCVILFCSAAYGFLWLSLPVLDGQLLSKTLAKQVNVERDDRGVVTVTGSTRADIAYGLGLVHAQDRRFQMDLLRRASAGELSELLGPSTVDTDRRLRVHGFRAVARKVIAGLSVEQLQLLGAYAAGVNAGTAELKGRPFEYLLLGATPQEWLPEDSILVVLAMFVQLQDPEAHTKIQRGLVAEQLPDAVARFLYADATDWDAAQDNTHRDDPVIPTASQYDLRLMSSQRGGLARHGRTQSLVGSNNWVLSGARTQSGAALIANDMHLGLRVPNTWYRARMVLTSSNGNAVDITGVTLPGAPLVVAGSNGKVAWGFTNSYGDFQDVVRLVLDPAQSDHYLTARGSEPLMHAHEQIRVRGAASIDLDVLGTRFGPVIGSATGQLYALMWAAHDPAALNLGLLDLETATNATAALDIAARSGIPAQNFVVGDAVGHIGWTIAGAIPARNGDNTEVPRLSTDQLLGFKGWIPPAAHPRLVDPVIGQIVTANARVVGGDALKIIGDGGYDRGARALQAVRKLQARGNQQTPEDMLAVQTDDTAVFLQRWHKRLVELLDSAAIEGRPRRAELSRALAGWTGHAAINDAAYRLVRAFRQEVENRVFDALILPAHEKYPAFRFEPPASFEGPLWSLLTAEPAHLVPPGSSDWRAFLLLAVDASLSNLDPSCPVLAQCTWGKADVVHIQHPLSSAIPALSSFLDMPAEQLPGDTDMPRVSGAHFGASERFGVSPGHEKEAYFEMPTGQSGHPLSSYYRAGHVDWAHGASAPFLPGPPAHSLMLVPEARSSKD